VPRGTYQHLGEQVEERFQCAPGPGGWRYLGERGDGVRVDLVVDSRWRQVRVEVRAPDWVVRGGLVGHELIWIRRDRGGDQAAEHSARAAGFLGESPGFLVAVTRSLGLSAGEESTVRLVELGGSALATLTVDRRWRLTTVETYETGTRPLPVERYEVADLATGEAHIVHLTGDVVLDAPGIELEHLETPPTLD
jgi:hypothetical protein